MLYVLCGSRGNLAYFGSVTVVRLFTPALGKSPFGPHRIFTVSVCGCAFLRVVFECVVCVPRVCGAESEFPGTCQAGQYSCRPAVLLIQCAKRVSGDREFLYYLSSHGCKT